MSRSIWNGTITFALIAVPIKVHAATEDKTVHFHQVHAKDGARIKQKRICSKEGKEVPYEEVARGYEIAEGEYVLLSQEEIDAAAGQRSRRIELEEFVARGEIDPVFYDRTYYLEAGEAGRDAYRLLHDALRRAERVGLGRWVFHNREYLAAVRALDGALGLHTMRFADELVAPRSVDIPKPSRRPSKREIEMAESLVDSLHGRFEPKRFRDTYRERVLELIARKAKGETVEIPEPEEPAETADLIGALEASLKRGTSRRAPSKPSKRGGRSSSPRRRTRSRSRR